MRRCGQTRRSQTNFIRSSRSYVRRRATPNCFRVNNGTAGIIMGMSQNVNGFNPLRWNCEFQGCWNKIKRPRIEDFAADFPRNIGMTDIDGSVELNGHFIFLEWKDYPVDTIPQAQGLYFERLTRVSDFIIAYFVHGDAARMEAYSFRFMWQGRLSSVYPCTMQTLHDRFQKWSKWTAQKPNRAALLSGCRI